MVLATVVVALSTFYSFSCCLRTLPCATGRHHRAPEHGHEDQDPDRDVEGSGERA
jgi:hypothetical protein